LGYLLYYLSLYNKLFKLPVYRLNEGLNKIYHYLCVGERENFYLENYLPLLNSVFSTSSTELAINNTLLSILKTLRYNTGQNYKRQIYVYDINKREINPKFSFFNNSIELSVALGLPRTSIFRYKYTSIPYRGKLFFTNQIMDLNKVFEESQKITPKGQVNKIISIKFWAYDALTLNLVNGSPFISKNKASAALGIGRSVIDYFLETGKAEGVKGNYLYSRKLKASEIKTLLKLSGEVKIGQKFKVWAYTANNLELINNSAFTSIWDAAAFFKVNYRTISRHLETKKATYQDGTLFF